MSKYGALGFYCRGAVKIINLGLLEEYSKEGVFVNWLNPSYLKRAMNSGLALQLGNKFGSFLKIMRVHTKGSLENLVVIYKSSLVVK